VLGIDAGPGKQQFAESLGQSSWTSPNAGNLQEEVKRVTGGGTHAAVVTIGHPRAFSKIGRHDQGRGGLLCLVGIPPGDVCLDTPIAIIVIKGVKIQGNLVRTT
jgi:Zn-dependent alcohol dehydrogenase